MNQNGEDRAIISIQQVEAQLFYEFDLDAYVPPNQVLRKIDRFLDMGGLQERQKPF